MGRTVGRTIKSLLWPAGLPFAIALMTLYVPQVDMMDTRWATLLPHVLCGGAILLALRFGHARIACATLGFWTGAYALFDGRVEPDHIMLFQGVLWLSLAIIPNRGLVHISLLPHIGCVVAMASVAHWPIPWLQEVNAVQSHLSMGQPMFGLPAGTLAIYGLSGGIMFARIWRHAATVDAGLFAVMAAWAWVSFGPEAQIKLAIVVGGAVCLLTALESGHALAFRDQLTGLPSRRAMDLALRRLGHRYTLAMVDVDFFKKFNDRYGHDAGDEALRMVASHLRGVRGGGRAYRYGGEEFAVVFPGRSVAKTRSHLESLRQEIANARFVLRSADRPRRKPKKPSKSKGNGVVKLTVSIGAAERNAKASTAAAVMKIADKQLYRAKKAGRNRVMAA
ncbi:MAG: GGDEF domain-containing protein [Myxococcota bacterium]|nr:GGDEF domain-containing protein [Myxococcota bacterium]